MTTTTTTDIEATGVTPARLGDLRRWNLALTALHLVQAIVLVVLASDFAITVTGSFPAGPPGTDVPAAESLFDIRIGAAIAAFLTIAALDHLLTATVGRRTYERDLKRGINRFRWVEYSLSSTIMVLIICLYTGITGIAALIAIIGANVAMVLFGWLQELMNPPGRSSTTMLPFWFGTIAGLAPWVALTINLINADNRPTYVIAIYVSLLALFMSFAANQWLQYRGIGPWRDYGYGEKAYLVLSLVAKSALCWQLFAGSLST